MKPDTILNTLNNSGVDTTAFLDKHKLLEAIPDIVDCIVSDIQADYRKAGLYRQDIKGKLNPVVINAKKYSSYFWNQVCQRNEIAAEQFGELSDNFMNELLTNKTLFKNGK